MIRAEDLMVGDWVKTVCPKQESYERVSDIHYSDYPYIITAVSEEKWFLVEVEPIPLTPEILEKNGFVNDNSVYGVRYRWESEDTRTEIRIYSPQSGYAGMTIIKNSYLVDEVSYDLPDVYMVHELQHALKLCGINLEIKI